MATSVKQPYIPITEIEHSAFCRTEDELKAKSWPRSSRSIYAGNGFPQSTCTLALRSWTSASTRPGTSWGRG